MYSYYPIENIKTTLDIEKELNLTERCDVCGYDGKYLYRTIFPYKPYINVTIRHHTWCDPKKCFEERFNREEN